MEGGQAQTNLPASVNVDMSMLMVDEGMKYELSRNDVMRWYKRGSAKMRE